MKNQLISNLGNTISKKLGKTSLKMRKNAPDILLIGGVIGFVGTVVLACYETATGAETILEDHKKRMESIDEAIQVANDDPEHYEYNSDLIARDKFIMYVRTGGKFAKLYGPSVALGALSLACILSSRNIMKKRYLGVVAAYNAVSEAFESYRKRVREELGETQDRHFRYGTELQTVSVKDEDGNKKKEVLENADPTKLQLSDTAVFFDESNPNWDQNTNMCLCFLKAQQNIANDTLHSRGFIFLNEVYDMLGFPQTSVGAVVGWVDGMGDDNVDFGLYNPESDTARRFVNGQDNRVLLDFNHDGVIWDKI